MLHFWGASDDLVECEGDVCGEIGCYEDFVIARIGGSDGGCDVVMFYDSPNLHGGAAWTAGIRQIDEDIPVPWPVRVETVDRYGKPGLGYSMGMTVACPPGTPVVWRTGKGSKWEVPS